MDVLAKIEGIAYKPFLCRELKEYTLNDIERALSISSTFIININPNIKIACSWWVSCKRTRSYPYARIYDSLKYQGKKITIIPILKDEGKDGDRDFLQWDTISLMSLLGIYVIIAYYNNAEKNPAYNNKITNQRFDVDHILAQIDTIIDYQSDALHWNLKQIDMVVDIGTKALVSYEKISKQLGVVMHSSSNATKRIDELKKGKKNFINFSRDLAKKAQNRESNTKQPKENLSGIKAKLTIKNYLGGNYFFTCDEIEIKNKNIYLIEGKHSKQGIIPSLEDIKDGLLKMILFTNLKEVSIGNEIYSHMSVLKLTSTMTFNSNNLTKSKIVILELLKKEALTNNFKIVINKTDLLHIDI